MLARASRTHSKTPDGTPSPSPSTPVIDPPANATPFTTIAPTLQHSDAVVTVLSTFAPIIQVSAQALTQNLAAHTSSHPNTRPAPPSSPPPPEGSDELQACLEGFAQARKLSLEVIERCYDGLSNAEYSPDVISEASCAWIQELTGL